MYLIETLGSVHVKIDVRTRPKSCVHVSSVFRRFRLSVIRRPGFQQRYMVSGIVLTCVVLVCLSVRVFLVARSSTNFASMPPPDDGGESSGTTPAVLQNVPFPSKLETKGNLARNWKRFRRVWSNYEIASRLVKQPKEERTATLLTCYIYLFKEEI